MKKTCTNCGRKVPIVYGRNQCRGCFTGVTISAVQAEERNRRRARDRARRIAAKQAAEDPDREPTEQELETLIAKQMACLPGWWGKDVQTET